MRILISNDDGIYSPGIMALYQAVRDLGQVTIVAPLVGRYATSMEMTGATLTLLKLDDELERRLKAPAHCAFWSVA